MAGNLIHESICPLVTKWATTVPIIYLEDHFSKWLITMFGPQSMVSLGINRGHPPSVP